MVNVPCDQKQDWDKIRDFTRKSVLQRLSSDLGCDVESLIVNENVMTPLHFEKATRTYAGLCMASIRIQFFRRFAVTPTNILVFTAFISVGVLCIPGRYSHLFAFSQH